MTAAQEPTEPHRVDATKTTCVATYQMWVPDELPEGATDDDVDAAGKAEVVRRALAAGYAIDPETWQRRDGGPAPHPAGEPTPGRLILWAATGVRVEAPQETVVKAEEQDDGAWVATLDDDNGGLIAVKHGLASEHVAVTCARRNGDPIGYVEAVPIADDEVEVITTPGTARIKVSPAPDAPESDETGPAGA